MRVARTWVVGLLAVLFLAMPNFAGADDKFEKEVVVEEVAVKLARDVTKAGYSLVTVSELKQWIDGKKEMVIVDTMPYEDSYKKAHIPSAKNFLFPIPDMNEWNSAETGGKNETDYQNLLGTDKDKIIVVYCGFVKCTRSHNAAVWAKRLGYKNVYRFAGGVYAWKGAGFPTEEEK